MTNMIGIIDYGMGNLHSVQKALEFYSAQTRIINSADEIKECQKLVLPGVGAFADAMKELKKKKLIPALERHIQEKKPFLGICLGMQLLFEESQESSSQKGLGILKGTVQKFKNKKGIKVPHIGWNQLKEISQSCALLNGTPEGAYVYFCHSYYPVPKEKSVIAAKCNYGVDFACVVSKENIYGVQFHPRKASKWDC